MPKEPMSATGQGRTQSAGATTSAKRPLADVLALRGDVCLVPILLKNSSSEHFGYVAAATTPLVDYGTDHSCGGLIEP
jgi:hypothetical protein